MDKTLSTPKTSNIVGWGWGKPSLPYTSKTNGLEQEGMIFEIEGDDIWSLRQESAILQGHVAQM